jgi:hypothetical protein
LLAYGSVAAAINEYIHVSESTAIECMKHVCSATVYVYGEEYFQKPNKADVERLMAIGE